MITTEIMKQTDNRVVLRINDEIGLRNINIEINIKEELLYDYIDSIVNNLKYEAHYNEESDMSY